MTTCIKNELKKGVKVMEERKLPSGRTAYLEWIVISRDTKNNKVTIQHINSGREKTANICGDMDESPITHNQEYFEWVDCFEAGGYII